MAQKNAFPNKAQAAIIKANGLDPLGWTVVQEFKDSMIVRRRLTGEFKHIKK